MSSKQKQEKTRCVSVVISHRVQNRGSEGFLRAEAKKSLRTSLSQSATGAKTEVVRGFWAFYQARRKKKAAYLSQSTSSFMARQMLDYGHEIPTTPLITANGQDPAWKRLGWGQRLTATKH